jgi:hypothetical protein
MHTGFALEVEALDQDQEPQAPGDAAGILKKQYGGAPEVRCLSQKTLSSRAYAGCSFTKDTLAALACRPISHASRVYTERRACLWHV